MTEVKCFDLKSMENVSIKIQKNSDNNFLKVPLKCVCIGPSQIFSVIKDELQLLSDKIKFRCISNLGNLSISVIEIDKKSIKKIQYSNTKGIFRVSIQSDTYSKYFSPAGDLDDLFTDSIWFCLKVENLQSYTSIIEYIHKLYLSTCVVSVMPVDIYDRFTNRLNILSHDASPIKSSLMVDIELSSRLDGLALTTSTQQPSKRRKLKRNYDLPTVIKIKRKCESMVSVPKFIDPLSSTQKIEIMESDLHCLTGRKYLNDNIINWYLTFIYQELLSDNQRQSSHFFNVFFYTKLIGNTKQQTVDNPETRYARVTNWTKKVDIFSKDFIVIPVFVKKHWFIVIVCYAWMAGIINYTELFNKQTKTVSEIPVNSSEFATKVRQERLQDMTANKNLKPMPCILVFDSICKENRSYEVNIIRHYLKSEWDSKRLAQDGPLIFDKSTCRGYSPRVMKQTNGFDCGLYLLQYVESFFKKPLVSYEKSVFEKGFCDWFEQDEIDNKRKLIKSTIQMKTEKTIHIENDDDDDEEYIL